MNKMILVTAAAFILAPTFASANDGHHQQSNRISYTGPVEITSVDTLLKDTSMFTERNVVVEGKLLRQVKGDTFIFSDGKGEIQVELDDDIIMNQPLNDTTKVRLFGEYEGGNTPEIEVDHIQIL